MRIAECSPQIDFARAKADQVTDVHLGVPKHVLIDVNAGPVDAVGISFAGTAQR